MKYFPTIYVFLFFSFISCKTSIELSETKRVSNLAVKSRSFRGTIFNEKYPFSKFNVSDVDSTKRFTPTSADILKGEYILRDQIKNLYKSRPYKDDRPQIIYKNLNNYFRQYVGIINPSGEKIIHVNFYWDKYSLQDKVKGHYDSRLTFEDDYAIVFGGGSHHGKLI